MYGYAEEECSGARPELASRLSRALAAIADGALGALFVVVGVLAALAWGSDALMLVLGGGSVRGGGALPIVLAGAVGAGLVFTLYQWMGLATRGQTLGKRLLGIQIVDDCGAPAGFMRALLLRVWVFSIVLGAAELLLSGVLGIAGAVLGIANLLFIFGAERRCLHDYLAGTWVREAPGSRAGAVVAFVAFGLIAFALAGALAKSGADLSVDKLRAAVEQRERLQATDRPIVESVKAAAEAARAPKPLSLSTPKSTQTIYRYVDESNVVHYVDDPANIPAKYRARAKPIE